MFESNTNRLSNGGAFGLLIGLSGAGLIAGTILSIGIWVAMTGKSILSMQTELMKPENMNAIKVIQVVSTFVTFFVPAWITARIANNQPFRWLGFNNHFNVKQFGVALLIMLASIPLVSSLATLNEIIPIPAKWAAQFRLLENKYDDQVQVLSVIKTFGDYISALFIMAILPAMFEETLFRGGMQNILTRWMKSPWPAILITSFLFSAVHISYYGFLPRFALGVVLGLLYYYSQNIWINIFAHAMNNSLIVTQMYLNSINGKPVKDSLDENLPLWWGIIGIVFVTALMWVYKRISERETLKWTQPEQSIIEQKWTT